jgi:hypothetical protein
MIEFSSLHSCTSITAASPIAGSYAPVIDGSLSPCAYPFAVPPALFSSPEFRAAAAFPPYLIQHVLLRLPTSLDPYLHHPPHPSSPSSASCHHDPGRTRNLSQTQQGRNRSRRCDGFLPLARRLSGAATMPTPCVTLP